MSRAPTHPGAILREDVFPELGVTVSAAARELGVSRQTLHRILNEHTAVTPEMAARLGKYCGNARPVAQASGRLRPLARPL